MTAETASPKSRLDAERVRLNDYIESSLRVQRRLRAALALGIVVAALAWPIAGRGVGFGIAALTATVVGIGYWITTGHISDWRQRLDQLAARDRERRAGSGG